jgi:hypothetical protein
MLFHMWWWLIPLMFFLAARGGRRRYYRDRGWNRGRGNEPVAELQRTVESQRDYIEQLEARLARVEEGLEFAERLLSERASAAAR